MGSVDVETGIYFEAEGPEDGMPAIFMHGFGGSLEVMRGSAGRVFASHRWGRRCRRLFVDLPGHGRSEAPANCTSSDEMLERLDMFVGRLAGRRPFLLAGESYGGYLALGLVARRSEQVAGLHLLCPLVVAGRSERRREPREVLVRDEPFLESLPEADRKLFLETAVIATPEVYGRFRENIVPGRQMVSMELVSRVNACYELSADPLATREVLGYSAPTLICCGRHDASVGWRDQLDLAVRLPRCSFALVDAAGHNLEVEHPQLYQAAVAGWLDRMEGALGA